VGKNRRKKKRGKEKGRKINETHFPKKEIRNVEWREKVGWINRKLKKHELRNVGARGEGRNGTAPKKGGKNSPRIRTEGKGT